MFWPSKFSSSATIFADNQNILKPLLSSQAAQSKVQSRTKVVREMLKSPRFLKKAVERIYGLDDFQNGDELSAKINKIRNKVKVKGLGSNYMKISYSDSTSQEAYRVINGVVDVFIKASSDKQRLESREAFMFIDNQVKQYKDQLVMAESRLKDFRTNNFDGRNRDVDTAISRLRAQLEELKISIDEGKTTLLDLNNQLVDEPEYSSKKYKTNADAARLSVLEGQRSDLLLTYTADYPDVISISYQIDDMKKTIREAEKEKLSSEVSKVEVSANDENAVLNPIYLELRSRISQVKTDIKAKEKRLLAFGKLQEKEYDRRKRIAERGAEESELTRDYKVTKRIYEDMLERKEKARLSMTLNIEGQGVTYRIQEPASRPRHPIGLRFLHFVLAGPFVGLFFTLGLIILYVLLDRKIRFSEELARFDVPVLAVVPHINTPLTKRVMRLDIILCFFLVGIIMAGYIGLAYASKIGLIG